MLNQTEVDLSVETFKQIGHERELADFEAARVPQAPEPFSMAQYTNDLLAVIAEVQK